MIDYKFTCVPKNLMLALDGNCKVMLFTLIQYSDYASGEDGWFYAPNTTLQTQAGLSKNLVIATLDTLYRAGIIDIKCIGVGTGHKSNRIKLNTSSFDRYDEYKVEDILGNHELQIRTVDYKNNYSPSYLQESKKVCKEVCNKVAPKKKVKKVDRADDPDDYLVKYAKENREHPTPAEAKFKKFLSDNKIHYIFQDPIRVGDKEYIIDFTIQYKSFDRMKKVAIEIDGGYHDNEEQKKKDEERDSLLRDCGWYVARIKNSEVMQGNLLDCLIRKLSLPAISSLGLLKLLKPDNKE